ncbi:hypothetical protein ABEB36_012826 [Hypothenemus hampei]|uniref:Uncharacterized protein n=1 Tax=Hypothenemus hampei TaxID=57062 RepID=A0ABD1E810_HYPHA
MDEAQTITLTGYHRSLALRVLLKGLRDPIGSLLQTKNPSDLNDALNMLTNDFQLGKMQNSTFKQKPSNFRSQNFNKASFPKTNFQKPAYNQQLVPYNSGNNNNYNYLQNKAFGQPFNQNAKQAGTFNTPGPSRIQNLNHNRNFQKPTPMSISTTSTYRPKQNVFQQNSQNWRNRPNVVTEELFNINDVDKIEKDECGKENDELQFFPEPASDSNYDIEELDYQNLN